MRLARLAWLSLLAALALAGCERAENTGATSIDEWPGFGNTGAEQHYSALDQTDAGNVADLKLAWFAACRMEAAPPGRSWPRASCS